MSEIFYEQIQEDLLLFSIPQENIDFFIGMLKLYPHTYHNFPYKKHYERSKDDFIRLRCLSMIAFYLVEDYIHGRCELLEKIISKNVAASQNYYLYLESLKSSSQYRANNF